MGVPAFSAIAQRDQQAGNPDEGGDPEAEHPAQQLGANPLERRVPLVDFSPQFLQLGADLGT